MRLSEYRAMLARAMPSMSNLGEATLQFHCVRNTHTKKIRTPWKTGRNTIASLRAMEKSGGKYAPAKGKYHINVGTQFHCVRNMHTKKYARLGKPDAIQLRPYASWGNWEEKLYSYVLKYICLHKKTRRVATTRLVIGMRWRTCDDGAP